ncbi:pentatricopeptide repeat-containing protein At2g45350, chloroplastic [Amborella trichopoda]|uniref:pentatricopeptide repeat-containing protein At2g45350, chloroplastic n=1 Tax=Amborella trichopoda TaxID=13333 RepID=UPI0009BD4126|nr:pentatricopeptide repeat-containing protein At2g45350, chloroplastic [Amborella trichopoda]XP_020519072.1 pentatricopeptide repeat-containing protein At2g45350, chloroplastic [Amborella trichopoda]|eukprot:XP_020519071.1 pentatricopeptide repeat-containing protein At2g45350, chloroplastic [Amborella trichopoda]
MKVVKKPEILHAQLIVNGLNDSWSLLSQIEFNSIIRAYSRRKPIYAILFFREMIRNGVLPNKFTYPFALKACALLKALNEGKMVHCRIAKTSKQYDIHAQGSLVHMYAKCGSMSSAKLVFELIPVKNLMAYNQILDGYIKLGFLEEACKLFDEMVERDGFSWNAMIEGYAKMGDMVSAQRFFDESPIKDEISFGILVNWYAKWGDLKEARQVFDMIQERENPIAWNSLIAGYLKNGEIDEALWLFTQMGCKNSITWNIMLNGYSKYSDIENAQTCFEEMPERDLVSYNSMIFAYMNAGFHESAAQLFESMPKKDVISWNIMIGGYRRNSRNVEAVGLFRQMLVERKSPDESTICTVLSAISDMGSLAQGQWIHGYIERENISIEWVVGAALIDMYCKCGSVEVALKVFLSLSRKSLDHYNSIIGGLASHGHGQTALELFLKMEREGVKPDNLTFISVLSACSHSGLVREGYICFEMMREKHQIEPKIEHYGCMVDLLSRAGLLKKATEMVLAMPLKPNEYIWRALLWGCVNYGDITIAELAAKELIELEPYDSSSYVLLSNIYGATGRWREKEEIRERMRERGVRKVPGCSSIEIYGVRHEFVVGDMSNVQFREMQVVLEGLKHGLVWEGHE